MITVERAKSLTAMAAAKTELAVDTWSQIISGKIEAAAAMGKTEITNPFSGMRTPPPDSEQAKTVLGIFKLRGFGVVLQEPKDSDDYPIYLYVSIKW